MDIKTYIKFTICQQIADGSSKYKREDILLHTGQMPSISLLDEAGATLRLLLILYEKDGVNLSELRRMMKERYGVGRAATDSSRIALLRLGLIEERRGKIGPNPSVLTYLTEKGRIVAERVQKLKELLEG